MSRKDLVVCNVGGAECCFFPKIDGDDDDDDDDDDDAEIHNQV